jgi:hypothetical protein
MIRPNGKLSSNFLNLINGFNGEDLNVKWDNDQIEYLIITPYFLAKYFCDSV